MTGSGHARASRRAVRHWRPAVAELAQVVTDGSSARRLTRDVAGALACASDAPVSTAAAAAAVAQHCSDDGQRAGLAAYLHVVRELPLDEVASAFSVDAAAARRLVERGTGAAPVTSADACRGWALVAPHLGRTDGERTAASGHLTLCRHCRNRLRAHRQLEQRVATAGTATVGFSVATVVVRTLTGGQAAGTVGTFGLPAVALSTAAALTAGAGALTATLHLGHHGHGVAPGDRVTGVDDSGAVTVGGSGAARRDHGRVPDIVSPPGGGGTRTRPPTTAPTGLLPSPVELPKLPVGGTSVPVPLPSVPLPTDLPVPTPTASVPSLPLPTVSVSVPPLLP